MTSLHKTAKRYVLLCSMLFLAAPSGASAEDDALKTTAKALAIQYKVDKQVEDLIDKKVPKSLVEFAKKYAVWGKLIYEKKLEYEWKF